MITVGTVATIMVLWYVVTALGLVSPMLLPSPLAVWTAFVEILLNGYKGFSLLQHIGTSLWRLLSAFGLAIIAAIPLGLLSGYNTKIKAALDPIINFYRPLPPLAYYTLLVMGLGIADASKVALLFLAAFAPIYVSCVSAVAKVNTDFINSAKTVGASQTQVFFHVILPSCLPDILTSLRTALSVAYTTLVSAEMVAAMTGIGWLVLDASNYLRSDIVFVGIIIMGITGILLDKIIVIIQNKFVPWAGK
ncbi:taurine ABC transporter permease [Sedimentibacter sp. SX930]|nr:taurine ABC transporter permease [Sedimentibacter sp. SX930]